MRHCPKEPLTQNAVVVEIPRNDASMEDAIDQEDKLKCDRCDSTFKLKIMLKKHQITCGKTPEGSPRKELQVFLQPCDASVSPKDRLDCDICTAKFKTVDNLRKHMRVVHAAVLKSDLAAKPPAPVIVPCLYCRKSFEDFPSFNEHFSSCPMKINNTMVFECTVCNRSVTRIQNYMSHIKNTHFEPKNRSSGGDFSPKDAYQCRVCRKRLPNQGSLITHLASHMASVDGNEAADEDSR